MHLNTTLRIFPQIRLFPWKLPPRLFLQDIFLLSIQKHQGIILAIAIVRINKLIPRIFQNRIHLVHNLRIQPVFIECGDKMIRLSFESKIS